MEMETLKHSKFYIIKFRPFAGSNSNTTHDVLISKKISYKSYKEICSGEKKKVNLGYWGDYQNFNDWVDLSYLDEVGADWIFKIENNSLVQTPPNGHRIYGKYSSMA